MTTDDGSHAVNTGAAQMVESLSATSDRLTAANTGTVPWSEAIDAVDPGFAPTWRMVRDNLAEFRVRFVVDERQRPLPEHRRRVFGTTAEVRAVRVYWRLPEETIEAEHTVWVTFTVRDGVRRVAGLADGPAETIQRPMWLLQPLRVVRAPGVAVIAVRGIDPEPWLAGLVAARSPLAEHGIEAAPLVAELPGNRTEFEQLLGVPPGSQERTGAASWTEGKAVRIIVNPASGGGTAGPARSVLLLHEAVHAATRSPLGGGPLWLHEGYADLVALGRYPEVADSMAAQLAADQRTHGVDAGPPSTAELSPGADRVQAAYARAWVWTRTLDWEPGVADQIYREVLAGSPLEVALERHGWTEESLNTAAQRSLRELVG